MVFLVLTAMDFTSHFDWYLAFLSFEFENKETICNSNFGSTVFFTNYITSQKMFFGFNVTFNILKMFKET